MARADYEPPAHTLHGSPRGLPDTQPFELTAVPVHTPSHRRCPEGGSRRTDDHRSLRSDDHWPACTNYHRPRVIEVARRIEAVAKLAIDHALSRHKSPRAVPRVPIPACSIPGRNGRVHNVSANGCRIRLG